MNEENKPLVSIITLVYNNAEYALPALEYTKNQRYTPVEHIIIDDCSQDGSADRVQQWIDDNEYKCTFIRHERNMGICPSLNELIRVAKGKYFYGISDDYMEPDKLIKDVALLEANPSFAYCYSNMIVRDMVSGKEEKRKSSDRNNLFINLLNFSAVVATPTTIYRTQALKDIGLFDEKLLYEDYDMFLRLLSVYSCGYRDDYSVIYCVHPKSVQLVREVEFQNDIFKILAKWKHVPNYWYYVNIRHQHAFGYFAVKNKKEARRHLLPSLTLFWRLRLYKDIVRYLFFRK